MFVSVVSVCDNACCVMWCTFASVCLSSCLCLCRGYVSVSHAFVFVNVCVLLLCVCMSPLTPAPGNGQYNETAELYAFLKSLGGPVVVSGDFNSVPTDPAITYMSSVMQGTNLTHTHYTHLAHNARTHTLTNTDTHTTTDTGHDTDTDTNTDGHTTSPHTRTHTHTPHSLWPHRRVAAVRIRRGPHLQ